MIPKENIIELTELFKQNFWMVYILFAIYFMSSLNHINHMKNDIESIQFIVENDTKKRFDSLIDNFEQYSFLRKNRYQRDNLFEHVNASISSLSWKGVETSIGWKNEIDKIIAFNTGLLKGSMSYYENERELIEVNQHLLEVCEKYPELRNYVSYHIAEIVGNVFIGSSIGISTSCFWKCFDPVLQRFGDNYFLYPNSMHRFYSNEYSEMRINRKRIWENKYEFYPQRKGMHWLDIEYTFWGDVGLQTFKFQKGLMVK